MKPAILVALLFRTLDAFRIFDIDLHPVQHGSEPASGDGVHPRLQPLLNQLNLGLGSAISVLIFLCVALIAVLFIKGFGASLAQQRG